MAQSYFIWNNIDCRAMGIIQRGPAPIVRPEERVKHIEIPGRSGDMTETESQDEEEKIFNSYIQTISISVRGGYRVREVLNWLKGSGFVTFSGEPDRKQAARIIGAVTLNKVSRNLDNWAGEIQFYCQPLKQLLTEGTVQITSSGSTVINGGDNVSRPKIKATASGSSMSITANGKTLTITGLTSGNDYYIDSDIMEVYNADRSALLTKNSVGDFPRLKPGSNTITGSGWSKLVIDRRERFL